MSKFCENCGAEMDDNQTVCPNCGNGAQQAQEPANESTYSNTSTSNSGNIKNIAIIGGVIAAIVVVAAILINILGSGWKKPINNYFKGMQKANSKTYLSAYPDFYVDKYDLENTYDDDGMEEMLDDLEDEYGEKIKITYKVKSKESIKKDDLKKVQEYIEKYYEEDVKVSAGKKVKVKATIKGKDDSDTDTRTLYVYKIDGKWKVFNTSPSDAKSYLKEHKDDKDDDEE